MTTQVLFFDVFSEKDPHLNAVDYTNQLSENLKNGKGAIL